MKKFLFFFAYLLMNITSYATDRYEQERSIADFTGIRVSQGIRVKLSQGNSEKVVVISDNTNVSGVVTKVEDEVLKIYFDNDASPSNIIVSVTCKDLKMISLHENAQLKTVSSIIVGKLLLELKEGSKANLEIKAVEIAAKIHEGSELNLKGAAGYLNIIAQEASVCNASELVVVEAKVTAKEASTILLNVDKELNAVAKEGSRIKYRGNASVYKTQSEGGTVENEVSKEL